MRTSRLCMLASASIIAAFSASSAAAQEQSAADADVTNPNEIIVTAQKRAQSVQDVPISITAVAGSSLGTLQMRSGTEIARQTPNL